MPLGNKWCQEHVPDLKKRDFVNAENQQVSICKKCGDLLYREQGSSVWHKPHYTKTKVTIKRKKPKSRWVKVSPRRRK